MNDPSSPPLFSSPSSDKGSISDEAVQMLARTKPWVRFMAVTMFIGVAFIFLAALVMLLFAVIGSNVFKNLPQSEIPVEMPVAAMGIFFGVAAGVFVIMGIIMIFPPIKLWKYANGIDRLMLGNRNEDLVESLNQQRSYWKFIGILTLVGICLNFVTPIVMGIASAALAPMFQKNINTRSHQSYPEESRKALEELQKKLQQNQ